MIATARPWPLASGPFCVELAGAWICSCCSKHLLEGPVLSALHYPRTQHCRCSRHAQTLPLHLRAGSAALRCVAEHDHAACQLQTRHSARPPLPPYLPAAAFAQSSSSNPVTALLAALENAGKTVTDRVNGAINGARDGGCLLLQHSCMTGLLAPLHTAHNDGLLLRLHACCLLPTGTNQAWNSTRQALGMSASAGHARPPLRALVAAAALGSVVLLVAV